VKSDKKFRRGGGGRGKPSRGRDNGRDYDDYDFKRGGKGRDYNDGGKKGGGRGKGGRKGGKDYYDGGGDDYSDVCQGGRCNRDRIRRSRKDSYKDYGAYGRFDEFKHQWGDVRKRFNKHWFKDYGKHRYKGHDARECCFFWEDTKCYFEHNPRGWDWPIGRFYRSARRAGYPWLNYGDRCYDYRNHWKLGKFCHCTREKFRRCVYKDPWQKCGY